MSAGVVVGHRQGNGDRRPWYELRSGVMRKHVGTARHLVGPFVAFDRDVASRPVYGSSDCDSMCCRTRHREHSPKQRTSGVGVSSVQRSPARGVVRRGCIAMVVPWIHLAKSIVEPVGYLGSQKPVRSSCFTTSSPASRTWASASLRASCPSVFAIASTIGV